MPGYGNYAFSLSTLIMLAPIARQAFVTASLGAPFTIQMLMTLAAIGAVIIGEPEEAAIVVLLFSLGELLEGVAAAQARSGIKALGALIPKTAMIEDAGKIREVAADSLTIGQVVVARPGDRIPADGVVIDGISSVDESPMTGESMPVPKEKDSRVFAGSINQDAALRIRVDRAPEDNTIARIILLVEEAQDAKAPTERFIDTFSRYYMPAIVALAALVAILPPLIGLGSWEMWIYRGLALLLIGCPCALVISVPAAIASSLSSAARHGMLLKGGAILETLAKAEIVAFDKTGTLTIGKPVVTDVVALDGNDHALLGLAAAIERESSHPLATAITAHADTQGADALTADSVRAVPGRGMEGVWNGQNIFIGAPRFAGDAGTVPAELLDRISALETDGKTVAVIMAGYSAKGLIALRDEPRPDAIPGLAALKAQNICAIMLSGDNARTAAAIGQKLGIEARGEMLPETKVEAIREMAESHTVVMVGDGINDAPALAAASVGIAIGSGTDVAMEAADAALMRNDIRDVARMIGLARATMRNIRQNVAIALGLKAVFLVTTVIGLSGLWLAVFADTGATVLVTLNAMRLLGYLKAEKA
jgi:Cd2+/Zn2+-exporting ATPase